MIDIEALKLTDLDKMAAVEGWEVRRIPAQTLEDAIADAQLAKALWGLKDELERPRTGPGAEFAPLFAHALEHDLKAAGIPKP